MSNYLFMFRVKESEDLDSVAYLEEGANSFTIRGASYCGRLSSFFEDVKYEDVETVLTEDEFIAFANQVEDFNFTSIYEKLKNEENQELFIKVQEEEKEYIKNKYNLTNEDVEYIWEEYELDYRDRGIVSLIYNNYEELGEEEAFSLGIFSNFGRNDEWLKGIMERHFDYESFGEEIAKSETYIELPSGKIASMCY